MCSIIELLVIGFALFFYYCYFLSSVYLNFVLLDLTREMCVYRLGYTVLIGWDV